MTMNKLWCSIFAAFLMAAVTSSSALAIDKEKVNLNARVYTVVKSQNSYKTPLDSPTNDGRGGANWRNDQIFRAKAKIGLSYGTPGKDEWFGYAEFNLKANDPDGNADDTGEQHDVTKKEVKTNYALISYRPFEMEGSRPLGITAGMIGFKATANSKYFHYFSGDLDDDFILYNISALDQVVGVNVDFHISRTTGIGFGYAEKSGDGSKVITGIDPYSTDNWIAWAEFNKWNFGWHGAYRYVTGEGSPASKAVETPMGNTYYEWNKEYDHIVANTGIDYLLDLDSFKLLPAFMYQYLGGDDVNGREVVSSAWSGGLKLITRLFGKYTQVAFLYSDASTEDINGLAAMKKGTGNYVITQGLEGLVEQGVPGTADLLTAWNSNPQPDLPAEETSSASLATANYDSVINSEINVKLSDNIRVGLFYHYLKTKVDNTMNSQIVASQMAPSQELLSQYIEAGGSDPDTADALAKMIVDGSADAFADTVSKGIEWTDTSSFGFFCTLTY